MGVKYSKPTWLLCDVGSQRRSEAISRQILVGELGCARVVGEKGRVDEAQSAVHYHEWLAVSS